MLKFLRKRQRSMFIVLAFVIIIVVFVFWGVGPTPQGDKGQNAAATVDGVIIPATVYNDLYRRQLDYYRELFKGQVNEEFLERLNLKKTTLNMLIERSLILNEAEREAIKATEVEVQGKIMAMPAFKKDSRFDKDLYFSVLQRNRINPADFEKGMEEDLIIEKMRDKVVSPVTVSVEDIKREFRMETRLVSLDYIEVSSEKMLPAMEVKDDEIKKYYADNTRLFILPAKVKAFYAKMDKAMFINKLKVSDEELKGHYDRNIVDYQEPKKFHASHILIKPDPDVKDGVGAKLAAKKMAEELLSRLKKDEDFSSLAKKYSQDAGSAKLGGDLGWFSLGQMVRPFEEALIKLKKGSTSDVVETEYGYHIIKLEDMKEEKVISFNEAKEGIKKILLREKSEKEARLKMAELYEAFKNAASVEALKKESEMFGATGALTGYITEKDAGNELVRIDGLRDSAFGLDKGSVSGIIDAADKFYIVKVMDRVDEQPAPLENVRDGIISTLKGEKAEEAAKANAEELLKRGAGGEGFSKLKQGHKSGNTGFFNLSKGVIPVIDAPIGDNTAIFELEDFKPYHEKVVAHKGNFYVLRLKDAKEMLKGFEERTAEIRERVLAAKRDSAMKDWLEGLKGKANITINEEVL